VRAAFLQIAATNPVRYRVIDADRDMEQVSADIVDAVNSHFALNLKPVSGEL
jgi:thymidylate kinase